MKTIIFLFLFSFSTISSVQAKSGQQWLSSCESNKVIDKGYCLGYLAGMRDMYRYNGKTLFLKEGVPFTNNQRTHYKICISPDITLGQEEKIMKKFLNENPELLHFTFTSLYEKKMMMTFPCK